MKVVWYQWLHAPKWNLLVKETIPPLSYPYHYLSILDWLLQDSLLDSRAYAFWFAGSESSSCYIETMDPKYLAHEILPILTTSIGRDGNMKFLWELKSHHHLGCKIFHQGFIEGLKPMLHKHMPLNISLVHATPIILLVISLSQM